MPDWLVWFGLCLTAFYVGMSFYGERHRHHSAFWRGWTDVSGWRIFGLNRDK